MEGGVGGIGEEEGNEGGGGWEGGLTRVENIEREDCQEVRLEGRKV